MENKIRDVFVKSTAFCPFSVFRRHFPLEAPPFSAGRAEWEMPGGAPSAALCMGTL